MEAVDYYGVLGLPPHSSVDAIKRSFRALALQHHPDKSSSDGETFRRIHEAYQILSVPQTKENYDRTLRTGGARASFAAAARSMPTDPAFYAPADVARSGATPRASHYTPEQREQFKARERLREKELKRRLEAEREAALKRELERVRMAQEARQIDEERRRKHREVHQTKLKRVLETCTVHTGAPATTLTPSRRGSIAADVLGGHPISAARFTVPEPSPTLPVNRHPQRSSRDIVEEEFDTAVRMKIRADMSNIEHAEDEERHQRLEMEEMHSRHVLWVTFTRRRFEIIHSAERDATCTNESHARKTLEEGWEPSALRLKFEISESYTRHTLLLAHRLQLTDTIRRLASERGHLQRQQHQREVLSTRFFSEWTKISRTLSGMCAMEAISAIVEPWHRQRYVEEEYLPRSTLVRRYIDSALSSVLAESESAGRWRAVQSEATSRAMVRLRQREEFVRLALQSEADSAVTEILRQRGQSMLVTCVRAPQRRLESSLRESRQEGETLRHRQKVLESQLEEANEDRMSLQLEVQSLTRRVLQLEEELRTAEAERRMRPVSARLAAVAEGRGGSSDDESTPAASPLQRMWAERAIRDGSSPRTAHVAQVTKRRFVTSFADGSPSRASSQ